MVLSPHADPAPGGSHLTAPSSARAARAAAIALFLLAGPAGAFHVPDVPVLDLVRFTEETHVAWRVRADPGSFLAFEIAADSASASFATFGLWFVDANTLEFSSVIQPSWYVDGGEEIHVGTALGAPLSRQAGEVRTEYLSLQVDFEPSQEREWLFVAFAAFDGNLRGRIQLAGMNGVTLLARSEGSAFLHTEKDFKGAANAVAREQVAVRRATAEAKVAAGAAVPEEAGGRMFAVFEGESHLGRLKMGYDGPDGTRKGATRYLLAGEPAGSYTFRAENLDWSDNTPACRRFNGGDPCYRTPVHVAGADVRVP